jgi:hypothetical protein
MRYDLVYFGSWGFARLGRTCFLAASNPFSHVQSVVESIANERQRSGIQSGTSDDRLAIIDFSQDCAEQLHIVQ